MNARIFMISPILLLVAAGCGTTWKGADNDGDGQSAADGDCWDAAEGPVAGISGADIFAGANGSNLDTITDFTNGSDRIRLAGYTNFDSFSDLVIRQQGRNTVIDFGTETTGDRIIILNATVGQFDTSDFQFI